MSASAASMGRLRRGWNYYRRYTKRRTGIHTGATAALTALGLLAYFQRWFVAVAIAAYLLPPIYLYLTGDDLEADRDRRSGHDADTAARRSVVGDADADADADADGSDGDADGIDTDSDGVDTDTDGIDTDSDSDG